MTNPKYLAVVSGVDVIKMDVPLFIRMLELAREDLKSDVQLHVVVEKVITASKHADVLTMDHYGTIAPHLDSPDEGDTVDNEAADDGEWVDDDDDIDPADLDDDDLLQWRAHEEQEIEEINKELDSRT